MILREMNKIRESVNSCEVKTAKFRETLNELDSELGRLTEESRNHGLSFTLGTDDNSFMQPPL